MSVLSPKNDPTAFAEIERAMQRRFGTAVRIENVVVPSLGGSNRTVIFDLVEGRTRRRLVSRQGTYEGPHTPFIRAEHQFAVMQLAHRHGFPVPEPIALYDSADALGDGFVTVFVAGETMPKRILSAPEFSQVRPRLARQVGELLALLHSIGPEELSCLAEYTDSLDPIEAQRQRYDSYDEAHPALELGFRWLERNRPPAAAATLVHGDFRTGNLMIDDNGVVAVLDWECCHLGQPAEDIGWLCTRSWRFGRHDCPVGGFGKRDELLDAYSRLGGRHLDIDEIRFWEVFGLVRWTVLNIMQTHGHMFGGRCSPAFAACGRNTSVIEYDLLMTLKGAYR
jgi:aminoglycoside phosphotransferase (APT) family kinase protein